MEVVSDSDRDFVSIQRTGEWTGLPLTLSDDVLYDEGRLVSCSSVLYLDSKVHLGTIGRISNDICDISHHIYIMGCSPVFWPLTMNSTDEGAVIVSAFIIYY